MSIVKLDEDSSAIYAFVTLMVEISTRGIRLLLWIFFSLNNKPSLNALTQKDSSRGHFSGASLSGSKPPWSNHCGYIVLSLLAFTNDCQKIANTKLYLGSNTYTVNYFWG